MLPCLALSIKGWIGGKSLQHTSVMSRGVYSIKLPHATEKGDRSLAYEHSWLSKATYL